MAGKGGASSAPPHWEGQNASVNTHFKQSMISVADAIIDAGSVPDFPPALGGRDLFVAPGATALSPVVERVLDRINP